MKQVVVDGPGSVAVQEVPDPVAGPGDLLIRPRAVGICGSDAFYIQIGGIPPRQGATPLGHEIAGEVAAVGEGVTGVAVGDHVVVNPMGDARGIIGNGGPTGGLAELLLIEGAEVGRSVRVVPDDLPWEVAALNEPMAVALHGVHRAEPKAGDKVVVFGAGPVGLGAAIAFLDAGVEHLVVVDVQQHRLEKALAIGAHAVIDSSQEDLVERLYALHGEGRDGVGHRRLGTDVYLDAAGAPQVVATAVANAKHLATISVVAVHKRLVEIDLGAALASEIRLVTAMGYPTEIFEVTDALIRRRDQYAQLISDRFDFADAEAALQAASTPGRADKVVVLLP